MFWALEPLIFEAEHVWHVWHVWLPKGGPGGIQVQQTGIRRASPAGGRESWPNSASYSLKREALIGGFAVPTISNAQKIVCESGISPAQYQWWRIEFVWCFQPPNQDRYSLGGSLSTIFKQKHAHTLDKNGSITDPSGTESPHVQIRLENSNLRSWGSWLSPLPLFEHVCRYTSMASRCFPLWCVASLDRVASESSAPLLEGEKKEKRRGFTSIQMLHTLTNRELSLTLSLTLTLTLSFSSCPHMAQNIPKLKNKHNVPSTKPWVCS